MADMAYDALAEMNRLMGNSDLLFVMMTDGAYTPPDARIPVLQGQPPGPARTYVTDKTGSVVLETIGMPPLFILQEITSSTRQ